MKHALINSTERNHYVEGECPLCGFPWGKDKQEVGHLQISVSDMM